MKSRNGFALLLTLLFVLLFTLFGFAILLLAGNYYASARTVFEKENARLACDQAVRLMVDRHNLADGSPRFFFDPSLWLTRRLAPFQWNGHEITASFDKPWSALGPNVLQAAARKGPFSASQVVEVRQRRIEDFALYTDALQELPCASLFDGPVFAREGIRLDVPGASFRSVTQGEVDPEGFATLRRPTLQKLDYPKADDLASAATFHQEAQKNGYVVPPQHPSFWTGGHYECNFDLLQLVKKPHNKWLVRYGGSDLAVVVRPILWFDGPVAVSQNAAKGAFSIPRPVLPVYVASAAGITILTDLHAMEDSGFRYPLALVAGGAVRIDSSAPAALRLEALVLALGWETSGSSRFSLLIEPSTRPATEEQKHAFRADVMASGFLLEDEMRANLLSELNAGEPVVWFRGGLALTESWLISNGVHVHFQGSSDVYPLIPALPFVTIIEGSRLWS